MSASVSIFTTKDMSSSYSDDNTYSIPVKYGSFSKPLDGIIGGSGSSFPVWVKNTGTTKFFNVKIFAENGTVNAAGGNASTVHDAYVEFALDNSSNLPDPQGVSPSVYEKAADSDSYAIIAISNVIDANGVAKTASTIGRDDDYRTMLPGEYCIVWTRATIDAQRTPGNLPIESGIYNVNIGMSAISSSHYVDGEISLKASALIQLYTYSDLPGEIYVKTQLAYWKFDEGVGTITEDSKSNHDGTIDGAIWWNIGIEGRSLAYDGNEQVDCGNGYNLNPFDKNYTIDCWFKIMDFVTGGTVVSKYDGTSGYDAHVDASGVMNYLLKDNLGNSVELQGGTVLNDTGWHYSAITLDRENNIAIVYVNGDEDIQTYDISTLTGSLLNNSSVLIGNGLSNFIGRIDEVALYNRVLSSDEVLTKYEDIWNAYLGVYAVTDDGEYVMDNGRHVVDEVF